MGNGYDGTNLFDGVVGVSSLTDGSGPSFIHTGNYGAFLGDTNLASLSQTFQTIPGQNYLFSFWLVNPLAGAGQIFYANLTPTALLQISSIISAIRGHGMDEHFFRSAGNGNQLHRPVHCAESAEWFRP